MKKLKNIALVLTGGFFLWGCGDVYKSKPEEIADTRNEYKFSDQPNKAMQADFMVEAYLQNKMLIEISKVAQTKALDLEVRQLADKIGSDLYDKNDSAEAIMRDNGFVIPTHLGEDRIAEIDKYKEMKIGARFDNRYVELLEDSYEFMKDHYDDVDELTDKRVRNWALMSQAMLHRHEEEIEFVEDSMNQKFES
ncbi:DUF4142 domain-containing protein [Flammeovirgaceae bacterium SG7u.111]|nr:DUF4142 domain-containing protein [Flammeovirgaceae bacterium SG7u.132]WPO36078.1 DUF4142 domain-containing protein [Flammeovirgaceae bacterium SG7u.111]